ncbi:predicted protein [Naegleria gruberi]|uniref:Predicted protein n=1 Tax=Naegleria gruberi TaxID=5762 RepID=D2VJN7_NAEGR|nr:uncharacterized protein NAEGRDRAFT_50097 [Naegleria gruberi]EFC42985.1 predicted protein [Naegleria gruberi]|eukprot:XP_002675729.1 predicted protein [Naegleria gruberi strain NEG-M]
MGNKATKFEPTPNNNHHEETPLSSLRKSSTTTNNNNNSTRSFRSNLSRANTNSLSRPGGLTSSRSQPTLVRFRENTTDDEDSSDEDEDKNRQNSETLKRKTPTGSSPAAVTDNSSSSSPSRSSVSSPAARNKRRSILLFLGRNNEDEQQQEQQQNGMQYLGNDIVMSDKVMDRSTELNESFLRQMKRRTLNLGSALFNRKLVSNNSPSSSSGRLQSPLTALNSSTVSVLAQMPLSDDDSDMEEETPKTPTNNRLSLVIENVPTVSSPNSSPTTNTMNYSGEQSVISSPLSGPNNKQLNSPGNRKSQLLLNLVMMGRKNVKNVESASESSGNLNQKTVVELIQMENENLSRTPPSPSGSSTNSSTSMNSIQMTFSQAQSNNKLPSPTPLHATTSSSNLTRQHSQLSSRRKSIGAFVFEPLRFNKISNHSISPNTNSITSSPNINNSNSKTTITNDVSTTNSPFSNSLHTLPTSTTRNTSPSTSTSIISSPNIVKNTSANNLLTINFPSHATLTPTTSQNSISPLSPRSPRSPIDRTLGESRIELRKKVFSVRLENKEGSNNSLVSLAFNGKAIDETNHSHHHEGVSDQEAAEIDHANLIDYKFHFLFSMSTTEGLIDKQLDLEDLENSSLSGTIETDSHRLNQSMIFLSSASNFHDRNSRKASYIKGLQTIFEKLYKTQMNLNESHVEDYEIHQQDRDTFKMTLMLGIPHLADKMIKSELDQVLQFNGEYETYVEKKRKEKRDLTIALQKMVPNTTEYEFTKGKIDNFLILKREEFFLAGSDVESSKVSSKDNSSNNLLIDTSNVFRIDRIDSTSNFISEKERVLIEQDQIKLKHPIKLFILFTTNNNQITNAPNVPGTFVNSKFFIKLLSKIGKITGLLPQFGFLHMSLIVSSMRFDWLDSELCVPKTKLKSMRAIACVEVGSVDNFSDLKKVTKIMGSKISFWNRNIHYCRGIGYHYNTSTVEEKANHQGSCHQFVFDLLDSLSSDITLVSEKPSIIGMHDLLKDDLLLGKKGCIGSYLDWCANNLVRDSPQPDNSEWCRIELGEARRKQFAPLLRNKINQLSSQMIIDEEEDDSREIQLTSYNKTLNLILFGNSFISSQKRRKSRALSIGIVRSPTSSPSTPLSEDSPRKKKKSDSVSSGTVVICFPTHSSLDEFVRDMVEVSKDEQKPFSITPEFYLLKSFDRALWLRNNFDKNKICRDLDNSKLPTHEFLVGDNRKRIIQGKDPLTSLDYLDELLYNDEEDSALELIKSLKNEPAKIRISNSKNNGKASLPTMKCLCPFGDPRRELPFIENATIPTD